MSAKGIIESVISELSEVKHTAMHTHVYRKPEDNLKLVSESVMKSCETLQDELRRAIELLP